MHVLVATHGHCFDGLASAVLFTRLLREAEGKNATFSYRGCGYGQGQRAADDAVLVGDQNGILDYRFSPSSRLTWYFDHHRTAFASTEDRATFDSRVSTGRFFFDSECSSCTKLIDRIARERFGVKTDDLAELVRWADIIDSAGFESPEQALDRSNPVLRLAAVVERHGDDQLLTKLVPLLSERPLSEVAASPEVTRKYRGISDQHERFVRRVRERATQEGRVVFVDLTDEPIETIGKFVTYALYPKATYSVIIGLLPQAVKISVGHNPWSGHPCDVDLSAVCARYGGGGHPYVGAVQFKKGDLDRAREVVRNIVTELQE